MRSSGRALILGGYVLLFWIVLPVVLITPHLFLAPELLIGVDAYVLPLLGAAPLLVGPALMVWATRAFRRHGRGLPVSHLPPVEMVWEGPYAFLRHPLYTGYILLWLGIALLLRSGALMLISVPALTLGCTLYAAAEERTLVSRFGLRYRRYRREVRAMLAPHRLLLWLLGMLLTRLCFDFRVRYEWPTVAGATRADRALGPRESVRHGFVRDGFVPEGFVPHGGCLVVTAHRNYLDPLFTWLALRRPIHFLTTHDMYRSAKQARLFDRIGSIRVDRYRSVPAAVRACLSLIHRGGAVGVFPSGGRSWTGEESYPADFEHLGLHAGVPIVPVALEGTYAAWPRWGAMARSRVRALILAPIEPTSPEDVRAIMRRLAAAPLDAGRSRSIRSALSTENAHTSTVRVGVRQVSAAHARGVTEVLYLCPSCRGVFTLEHSARRGGAPARADLVCARCGARFELVTRDAIADQTGRSWSLLELRRRGWTMLPRLSEPLQATGTYWREYGDRSRDEHLGKVTVTAAPGAGGLTIRGPSTTVELHPDHLDAVLIRGNSTLQLYAHRILHTIRIDGGRALALRDHLRILAFGDPMQRRRGVRQVTIR